MRVEHVRATDFRCYDRLDCELGGEVLAIVGRNGAGKTSLLEAVHFGGARLVAAHLGRRARRRASAPTSRASS